MIKDSLNALGASARDLLRNWRGLLLLAALYAALLASVYFFFATGVANSFQLVMTALTALAVPLLFLLLQAGSVNAALPGATFGTTARGAARDLLKVLLLAIPVAALVVLFVYLSGKLQGWLPKVEETGHYAYAPGVAGDRPVPLHWQEALVSTLWLVLLGIWLPLLAAHLWLSAARDGLWRTLKRVHRVAGRAFLPRSLLVYAVGLVVFGLTPYFVIYTRTSVTNGWAELILFALRLTLAYLFTLFGWVVTLGGLARLMPPLAEGPAAPVESSPAPEPAPEPAGAEPQLQV